PLAIKTVNAIKKLQNYFKKKNKLLKAVKLLTLKAVKLLTLKAVKLLILKAVKLLAVKSR
ncbi:11598_t:CDS:1, partial [Racocetra fulgida]